MTCHSEAICGLLIVIAPLFFHDMHKGTADAKRKGREIFAATRSIRRQLGQFVSVTRFGVSEMSEVSVRARRRLPTFASRIHEAGEVRVQLEYRQEATQRVSSHGTGCVSPRRELIQPQAMLERRVA